MSDDFITTIGRDESGPWIEFEWDGRTHKLRIDCDLPLLNADLKRLGIPDDVRTAVLGDVQRGKREGFAA